VAVRDSVWVAVSCCIAVVTVVVVAAVLPVIFVDGVVGMPCRLFVVDVDDAVDVDVAVVAVVVVVVLASPGPHTKCCRL